MSDDVLRVWTKAGVVLVAAGAMAVAAPALQSQAAAAARIVVAAAQAGEGGEGGEGAKPSGTAAADPLAGAPPDVALAVNLGLIRGHLRAAEELVAAGNFKDAVPHVHHPIEEIYDGIKGDLAKRNIAPFEDKLDALMKAIEAQDAAAFAQGLKAARAALDAAQETIPGRETLGFQLANGLYLLKSAVPEYGESIADGSIKNVVEYQDARGFIQEATLVFTGALPALKAKDAQAASDIQRALDTLNAATPTIAPPEKPIKSAGAVMGLTSLVELAVGSHSGD
ncbi:MAG: hypothetical protein U1E46_10575 [Hyphomicrobiales bacterium]